MEEPQEGQMETTNKQQGALSLALAMAFLPPHAPSAPMRGHNQGACKVPEKKTHWVVGFEVPYPTCLFLIKSQL